jgi:ABC-type antimicrobial peptide transport system permease subunit
VAAHAVSLVGLREGETTRRVFASVVSASYFDTLGVALARGRGFSAEEERPGAGIPVVVISDPLWRRMGADAGVLGQTITVAGRSLTIVGVAPRGFTGTSTLLSSEVYVPTGMFEQVASDMFRQTGARLAQRDAYELMLIGRLRPGVTQEAATATLAQIARDLERTYPKEHERQTMLVRPLPRLSISTSPRDDGAQLALLTGLLMAMSGSVLLIACLNLANMLLARGTSRRKEIAIRQAIGGSRVQIVRQLLVEGAVLSIVGACVGLLFS